MEIEENHQVIVAFALNAMAVAAHLEILECRRVDFREEITFEAVFRRNIEMNRLLHRNLLRRSGAPFAPSTPLRRALETHFSFFGWAAEFFTLGKTDFTRFGKVFDLVFPSQSRRIVGLGFLEYQPHRPMGGGVFGSFA